MNYLSIYSIADRILNQNKKRTHFSAFFVIKVFVIISTTTTTIICICMCVYTIYSRECLKVAATRVCWISKSTFITFVSENDSLFEESNSNEIPFIPHVPTVRHIHSIVLYLLFVLWVFYYSLAFTHILVHIPLIWFGTYHSTLR